MSIRCPSQPEASPNAIQAGCPELRGTSCGGSDQQSSARSDKFIDGAFPTEPSSGAKSPHSTAFVIRHSSFVILCCLLLLAATSPPAAHAQTDSLIKARPDFQNQLYLAAPTNAPGTSLAQPASIALYSGAASPAGDPRTPNDGAIYLAQAAIGLPAFRALDDPQPAQVYAAVNGNGTLAISPQAGQYFVGDTITLTATPNNTNWTRFLRWSDGNTNKPRTIIVGTTNVFTAIFTNFVPLEQLVFKQWERVFGSTGDDVFSDLSPTSDGGFILAGNSNSDPSGNKSLDGFGLGDGWVIKVDAFGNKQWEQVLGGNDRDSFSKVRQTLDGGYILAGFSSSAISGNKTSPNYGNEDAWVVKLDSLGNVQWDRTLGGAGVDIAVAVEPTSDGGYLVGADSDSGISGNKTSAGYGGNDFWVIKLNSTGNTLWEKAYGGSGRDDLYDLRLTGDEGFILAGFSISLPGGNKSAPNYGDTDFWVVKADGNGAIVWDRSFGGVAGDAAYAVQQTADGGYIVSGLSSSLAGGNKTSPSLGDFDAWVIRLDGNGNALWDKTFGGTDRDFFNSVEQTSDGGYILGALSDSGVSGNKTSPNSGLSDYWIVRLDADGKKLWDNSFGGSAGETLKSVSPTTDGGYILGGVSTSGVSGTKTVAGFGSYDYWLVKLAVRETPVGTPLVLVNGQYSS